MKRHPSLLGKLLFLALTLFVLTVQAATGPEVAQLLNTRYRNTPLDCPGNHAAYFCSGVLVSDLAGGFSQKFWEHTPTAKTLGARGFSYLRSDLDIRTLTQNGGMVFSDPFTAISQGKAVDVLCAYPLTANILQGLYGCGTGGSEADPASCSAQGVSDAPGWLAHFQQQGQDPLRQCSLSSRVPAQFRASLLAHEQLGGGWVTQPNKLMVRNWDERAPGLLPLQALFYDVNKTAGLREAQINQRDYYTATGQWLPILRLNLAGADRAVFEFSLQDQLYVGYEVAERLNARYADTSAICPDGSAAYDCDGVLIRITEASATFHAWNPSTGSIARNGIAFSYVRADVPLPKLAWAGNQGLLMKELAAPAAHPLTVRCAFPWDGATFFRSDSCNEHSEAPGVSKPCAEQGITTAEQWLNYFYYDLTTNKHYGCSFKGDASQFAVNNQARALLTDGWRNEEQNEVVIANWGADIPTQIPLEAFFYVLGSAGLPHAAFFQNDYFQVTGQFLPVVRFNLAPTANEPAFSYNPQDQLDVGAPNP
ncbi:MULTISPECIES: hypothetical protein [Pseudomonas]|uniref:hypothetical protein n=1 Tax=Pseudomonas TaxID=286 RepID=UPI000E04C128|nr:MULTISPECIES: hypothetical protein [Pseudomonas]RBH55535.1 hypothetical protein C3F00_018860 [Pseudomonas sp. MWU13-2860]